MKHKLLQSLVLLALLALVLGLLAGCGAAGTGAGAYPAGTLGRTGLLFAAACREHSCAGGAEL